MCHDAGMDRMATCPHCRNPVRLTKAELIEKRGTCLLCDQTFDVTASDLAPIETPYRRPPAAIETRRSAMLFPGVREDVDARRLELTTQRAAAGWTMSGFILLPML